jgi:hypothetical protein
MGGDYLPEDTGGTGGALPTDPRAWNLLQLTLRDGLPRLSKALAPSWLLLMLALVQLDAMVDWGHAARLLAEQPASVRWAVALTVVVGWVQTVAPALGTSLRAPRDRWRWRLPLSSFDLAVGLAPAWGLAVLPLVAVGQWMVLPLALPAAAVAPAMAWASGRRGTAVVWLVASAAMLWGALWVPFGGLWLVAAALGGARALAASPPTERPTAGWLTLRPRGPLSAAAIGDLLALWRLRRSLVLGPLFVSVPAWAVQSTAVDNVPLHGASATVGGLVVLTLAGSWAAGAVLMLPTLLGRAFDPRRAPLSPGGRVASLGAVGWLLCLPVTLAVLVAGSGAPLRVGLHAMAMALGAAWFSVGLGRRTDADRGSFLWWVLALLGLAFAPVPWGPLGVVALVLLSGWGAAHTLSVARRVP